MMASFELEPQFTIEEMEDKVIRMVEIAAETCEKLSEMNSDQQVDLAGLGTEYLQLAKDIKVSLKAHVHKLIDLPVTTGAISALKDYRELEIAALKTDLILKQLTLLKGSLPFGDNKLSGVASNGAKAMETDD